MAWWRAVRSRSSTLAAAAVTVALTAAFAAWVATAWTLALPLGARSDLASSSSDSLVISAPVVSSRGYADAGRAVATAVGQDAPGIFDLEQTAVSQTYPLPGTVAGGYARQTYVVSAESVQAHASLVLGSWPRAAQVPVADAAAVPVALSTSAAGLLNLHLGQTLTLEYLAGAHPTTFVLVGEYREAPQAPDQAALAWNTIGSAGIVYNGTDMVADYGPLVAAPAAFTAGALPIASASWTLIPHGTPTSAAVSGAVRAVTADQRLSPSLSYSITDLALTRELTAVTTRLTLARGELLATACLVGVLAGLALAVAAGSLVSRGEAHIALMRSRGAPAARAAAGYLPDVLLLAVAAAIGTCIQGPLLGRSLLRLPQLGGSSAVGLALPAADWFAGLCVTVVAAVIVLARAAASALPAQVAAASGRQAAVSGLALAGTDVALAVLAVVALWQASKTGVTGNNSGTVLIVACAPALAAAAGAAMCGRLISVGARLSEVVARRARALPVRLAAWELARTPRRHLVPALLAVAAVAGCGFAAAENASAQRSAHDQANFQTGADVAVNLAVPQPVGQVSVLAHAPGVQSATAVYQSTPQEGPVVVAVNAKAAAQTVAMRPDQADRPLSHLWSALAPATAAVAGFPLPGKPIGIGIDALLKAPSQFTAQLTATVQDAAGISYVLPLGVLQPDGRKHTMTVALASTTAGIDYPLRLVGLALDYGFPLAGTVSGSLDISGVSEQATTGGAYQLVDGMRDAIADWNPHTDWNQQDPMIGCGTSRLAGVTPPAIDRLAASSAGVHIGFSSGGGGFSPNPCALELTAGNPGAVLPAIATAAFLSSNHLTVGAMTNAQIDQIAVKVRIVASVSDFPTLAGTDPQALIVDYGALSNQALLLDDPLPQPTTWLLHTANGKTPPGLPVASTAANARQTAEALLSDPETAVPQRISRLGAVALVLLALLGLVVSLLSAARSASTRDTVLCALGMTRRQRAALGCVLHTAVAAPAAVLGVALGLILARLLVPVFTLSPAATTPVPAPAVLYAAHWSLFAFAGITFCVAVVAFALCARRRDPAAISRWGG